MIRKLLFMLLLLNVICCFSQENQSIKVIDMVTFKNEVIGKDVQLIDIRTPKEYLAGYIDDAVNINSADQNVFIAGFQKLDKTKPVYIYCYSGVRSHRVGKKLKELGFEKIYDFKEGYKAWSNP